MPRSKPYRSSKARKLRITIVGAGPAGLYAAILIKKASSNIQLRIVEQNPPDSTFGFGVVFSDQALMFLRDDDPETASLIEPHMKRWSDITIVHREERITIDGIGFSAIGRLELLQLLQKRARLLGAEPEYNTRLESSEDLSDSDLVIGADGLNSIVRGTSPSDFGEEIEPLQNRFVWYGANREFDTLTQTFIETEFGPMNAHHYSYAPGRSTFIIEMAPKTFTRAGFDHLMEPDYRSICERLFAEHLDGATLIPNNSIWRRFPRLSCQTWFTGNRVLVGDALHTAHFSIGSGTRLALEDVIALVAALKNKDWNIESALPAYQASRAPILRKITEAAAESANWYEAFEDHMKLEAWPFAVSYVRRAGRIAPERLRSLSPGFTAALDQRGITLDDEAP